jgi:2-dehydro-3-deoxyphosphogluconate aldolase/(4S)-4-hydroxy-2-oxoglutarate aldolase
LTAHDEIVRRLRELRVVPVLIVEDAAHAAPLSAALSDAGLPCAEVTFRTAAAADVLRRMREARPEMLIGAGTVLTPAQAVEARAAGAAFVVAPGFSPPVVDYCQDHDIPVYPGVCTPTEIEAAMAKGLRVLKFFPAEAMGGVRILRALAAPYGDVSFIPTGGIDAGNVLQYLALDHVVACGGSWMVPAELLRAGKFDAIRAEIARTVTLVRSAGART